MLTLSIVTSSLIIGYLFIRCTHIYKFMYMWNDFIYFHNVLVVDDKRPGPAIDNTTVLGFDRRLSVWLKFWDWPVGKEVKLPTFTEEDIAHLRNRGLEWDPDLLKRLSKTEKYFPRKGRLKEG